MTTFAQVFDGCAHNVVVGETFDAAIDGTYNATWVQNEIDAGRPWTIVPDGTKHGAVANGDGTFTNPSAPVHQTTPQPITKAQFQALYSANGNDLTATLAAWPEA